MGKKNETHYDTKEFNLRFSDPENPQEQFTDTISNHSTQGSDTFSNLDESFTEEPVADQDHCPNKFVLLTLKANKKISWIHHRMPVLLDDKTTKMWLDPIVPYDECYKSILESNIIAKGDDIEMYEVSSLVNKVSNQSADCILPKTQFDDQ